MWDRKTDIKNAQGLGREKEGVSQVTLRSLSFFPHQRPLPQITRVLLRLLACFRDLPTILACSGPQDDGENGSRKSHFFRSSTLTESLAQATK